jgi:endonuclease III
MDQDDLFSYCVNIRHAGKKGLCLKKCAEVVQTEHDGIMPKTFKELVSFPGIGTKLAHTFL